MEGKKNREACATECTNKIHGTEQYILFVCLFFVFVCCRESRYLLILTENYAALPIIQRELLKEEDDAVVIFGSSFPKDQEYTQVTIRLWRANFVAPNLLICPKVNTNL